MPAITANIQNIAPLWQNSFTITPSDTVDLTTYSHGLLITVAGNVKYGLPDGSTITQTGLLANDFIGHAQISRVYASGTTATVVGGY